MSCKVATHYIYGAIIATQLQLCLNNSFSTTMQLHYNYTYDVMLTSLIVIHIKKNLKNFFFEILNSILHYDY
jgi:hypothetical protein